MSTFIERLRSASAKKAIELDYTKFTKDEIYYLMAWTMGTKIERPQDRPDLSDEIMDKLKSNITMGHEIMSHYNTFDNAVVTAVTPISWDEKKISISPLITTSVLVKPAEVAETGEILVKESKIVVEKVSIDERVVGVPRVYSIPQTDGLSGLASISTLHFSAQAVNAAIAVGNLTERNSKGMIVPAIGIDAMKKLKIPFITEASVKALCNIVADFSTDLKASTTGMHGLEWMNVFYNHLVAMTKDNCFVCATKILGVIYSSGVPFVRSPNRTEFNRIKSVVAEASVKHYKVQISVATLASVALKAKADYTSTLIGCTDSRNFRKTDGKGMSGANQGAYTGEFQTKSTRNLRGKLTIVSALKIPEDMMLYIYTEDTDFLRQCPSVIDKSIKWQAVTKSKMDMPNVTRVNMAKTLQKCAALAFIDDPLPNLNPKKGISSLVSEQKDSLMRLIQPLLLLDPSLLIFPCKVLDLAWNPMIEFDDDGAELPSLYGTRNCAGPSPHNLEYYKCIFKKEKFSKKSNLPEFSFTPEHDKSSYLKVCNVANSYRNTWFLHRTPLEEIFNMAKCIYVPLVPAGKAPPLKAMTENELQVAITNGEAVSPEDLINYYKQFSSKSDPVPEVPLKRRRRRNAPDGGDVKEDSSDSEFKSGDDGGEDDGANSGSEDDDGVAEGEGDADGTVDIDMSGMGLSV